MLLVLALNALSAALRGWRLEVDRAVTEAARIGVT